MRLYFLYGPPAVGKLSVARALADRTGAAVFHNHVSLDYALNIFERGTPEFGSFVEKLRLETFAFCARVGRDLIFTFVYAHGHDEAIVRRTVAAVRAFDGAEIVFVHLHAARDELLRRVSLPSREEFEKISDPSVLDGLLKRYDLLSPIGFVDGLSFDTMHLEPAEVAQAILDSLEDAG